MKMSKFEKKFGKYAIENLTLFIIAAYVIGYVILAIDTRYNLNLVLKLSLDPYQILHGEVWRLFTWILIPPASLDFFTIIMLFFYYSIGTALERTWGAYRYNVYLFSGMGFTVLSAFLYLGYLYLTGGDGASISLSTLFYSLNFSTYYINLSIFLAFAATYPEAQVLLMFVIPVKMKWMAILDIVLLVAEFMMGGVATKFVVGAALLNFVVFYLTNKNMSHMSPKQIKRRAEFQQEVKRSTPITRHKCAICGKTEKDDEGMAFRFCSKCNGNYEYCSDHLFTHEHVK